MELHLRDLAREVLGPQATPAEVRAFVLGEAAGRAGEQHREQSPAQLRHRIVRRARFVRARRIAAELVPDRLPGDEAGTPYVRLAGVPL